MQFIIVPTDFSKAAESALNYAKMLSSYYDYGIKLVHVYSPTPSLDYELSSSPILQIEKQQRERLESMASSILEKQDHGGSVVTVPEVRWELVYGFAGDEIIHMSKSDECAFIIMGSTGETGMLSKLFGKVSTYVATHAHCPVLLVPQNLDTVMPPKHLLYCSDDLQIDSKSIYELQNIASKLDATVHLLHVNSPNEFYPFEPVLKLLEERDSSIRYVAENIEGDHIEEAILTYANEQAVDMVILTRKSRSAFGNLLHRSITKKVAFFGQKPTLILHEHDRSDKEVM